MCGIAGFSLSPTERVNARRLTKHLLLGIEHRGKDATGFAFTDSHGDIQVHKQDVTASEFVRSRNCMPKRQRSAIMHTRAWTQGSPTHNENNHPIVAGPIVGVHNGMLMNDHDVWREIGWDKQKAVVDSEAIFALLAYGPFNDPTKALSELYGSIAVAWFDMEEEVQRLHLARVDSSPLIIGQTEKGSLLFASTVDTIESAAKECGLELTAIRTTDEGNYMTVLDGTVEDVRTFTPLWGGYNGYRNTRSYTAPKRTSTMTTAPKKRTGSTLNKSGAVGGFIASSTGTSTRLIRETVFSAADMGMDDSDFHSQYAARQDAINKYLTETGKAADTTADRNQLVKDAFHVQHAALRPGDYIETCVGTEVYTGECLMMPYSFPEGVYTHRVCVPKWDSTNDDPNMEWVVVRRNCEEFYSVCPTQSSKAADTKLAEQLTAGEGTVCLRV